jgi:GTP-binding protein HflX
MRSNQLQAASAVLTLTIANAVGPTNGFQLLSSPPFCCPSSSTFGGWSSSRVFLSKNNNVEESFPCSDGSSGKSDSRQLFDAKQDINPESVHFSLDEEELFEAATSNSNQPESVSLEVNENGGNSDFWSEEQSFGDVDEMSTNLDDEFSFVRDEDDMMTEREDRLYTDEKGLRRAMETCILVGVEDLSAMRRSSSNRRNDYDGLASSSTMPPSSDVYFSLQESMNEMRELIKTAGMECVAEITQRLNEPNRKTYVGTGKVQEAEDLMKTFDGCCTIVFDAELSPGQQKALENMFNKKAIQNDFSMQDLDIKVIDRTALILDIFAQHARTREGKLQVDLALHEYRKPRLTKMWTHLERQSGAGGVGLRGPGESQLEIDKRLVRDRIITLKKKIDDVQKQRNLHRRGRDNLGLPILSLVGYTNAGKTTLLNYLTRAGAMAEDILFATLDPTTRKVKLPGFKTHPEVLITDTVGFIQKLPTQLVAAFRATLEEVQEADVLVHIIDVSHPLWKKQEAAVMKVLNEIGAGDKPIVRVLNKIDLLEAGVSDDLIYEAAMEGHSVAVSSVSGQGMEDFVSYVEEALVKQLVPVELEIPFENGDDINLIHEVGNVETIDYRPNGTYICGRVPVAIANRLKRFSVVDENISQATKSNLSDDDIDWVAIGRGRHTAKDVL